MLYTVLIHALVRRLGIESYTHMYHQHVVTAQIAGPNFIVTSPDGQRSGSNDSDLTTTKNSSTL